MDAGVVASRSREEAAAFWKGQARRYDGAIRVLNRRFEEMTGRVRELVSGRGDVLELAAGTGLVTQRIAPVVTRLVATDRSDAMLEVLRGRMADVPGVEIRSADALALPFADDSFDALVAANLLHLLPNPALALAEMRRVLRPSGLLCAPTFCHGDTPLAHVVSRLLGLVKFPVVTRFSGDSLVSLLEAAGVRVETRARYAGVLPLWLVARRDSRTPYIARS
jgi:ubiquinone/menaquinone biosynthesis C-methylase UbiE